jgi:hypothetical protein
MLLVARSTVWNGSLSGTLAARVHHRRQGLRSADAITFVL